MAETIACAEMLTRDDLRALRVWIDEQISPAVEEKKIDERVRRLAAKLSEESETVVCRFVKCGKATCWCKKAQTGHGPYWYAYRSEGGRTRSRYVGRKLRKRKARE